MPKNQNQIHKSIFRLTFLLLIFISFNLKLQSQSTKWKLDKDKNGVKIYLRKHKETGLKEAMGVMQVRTSLSAILTLLKDYDNQKNWLYANKSSNLLQSRDNFHWILHTVSEAPWPFQNRDLISEADMQQDTNRVVIIKIHAKPDYIAVNEDIVRIKYMHSEWKFTPKRNGMVTIRFKIRINLGGSLPVWVMNLAVDRGPFNTLVKMREQLMLQKYKCAKLDYLRE